MESSPLPDWHLEKMPALQKLRHDCLPTITTILSLPLKKCKDALAGMLTMVAASADGELWSDVCHALIRRAQDTEQDCQLTAAVIDNCIEIALKYEMMSLPAFSALSQANAEVFFRKVVSGVFTNEILQQKGSTWQTMQQMLALAEESGLTDEKCRSVINEKCDRHAINVVNMIDSETKSENIIHCLDFLFEGQPFNAKHTTELLHSAGSKGSTSVVKWLLGRFEELVLDEETLVWSCRCDKKDLAELVLSRAPNLPRSNAIKIAATKGNSAILELLLPQVGEESNAISEALFSAAQTSITRENWKILDLIATNKLLDSRMGELFDYAYSSQSPSSAIKALLSSPAGQRTAFSTKLSWRVESLVQKHDILPVLFLGKSRCLLREVTEHIWSFSKRDFEASPIVSTSEELWSRARHALETDFGCRPISRNGNCFDLPNVAEISFNGCLRIKERFDLSDVELSAEMLLSMSERLGGCFLASNNSTKSVYLKRTIPLIPDFRYCDLRAVLTEFRRVSQTFGALVRHFRSTKILMPVSKLSFVSPDLLDFSETRLSQKRRSGDLEYHYTLFHQLRPKRARMVVELQDQCNNADALLSANMDKVDEVFYARSETSGVYCACVYTEPEKKDVADLVTKLANRAGLT